MATAEEIDRSIINSGIPTTTINLNDPALQAIDTQTNNAINASNERYNALRDNVSNTIGGINNQLQTGYDKLNQGLREKTDQAVKELEQQKDYAYKDYQKEQRGAYTDYKKATDIYGTNADILHRYGLDKTGYAESSMIAMYNTYQNRVATARESWNRTQDNFNNAIANAKITGNVEEAQNALSLLQAQSSNLLTGLGYQVSIMQNAIDQENTLRNYGLQQKNFTYGVMSDNLNRQTSNYNNAVNRQMQRDESAREQANWDKQFEYNRELNNEKMNYQRERDAISDSQWQQQMDYTKNRDAVKDSQWQTSFDYQRGRDNVSDSQWQQTYDLNKTNSDRDYDISNRSLALKANSSSPMTVGNGGYTVDDSGNVYTVGDSGYSNDEYSNIESTISNLSMEGMFKDNAEYYLSRNLTTRTTIRDMIIAKFSQVISNANLTPEQRSRLLNQLENKAKQITNTSRGAD